MSNLDLWNDVCVTDPDMTKKVNKRGGFTSIDAHYQVKLATEAFGPIGKGWGYNNSFSYVEGMVICSLTFWWVEGGSNIKQLFVPVPGCSALLDSKGKPDIDAHKKAMTDGLTKALSHLGFNADVFMGYFDDNKYVEGVREGIAKQKFNEQVLADIGSDMVNEYQAYVRSEDVLGLKVFWSQFPEGDDRADALWDSWPKGQKAKMHKAHRDLQGREYALIESITTALAEAIENEDEQAVVENWDEIPDVKKFILPKLSEVHQVYLKDRFNKQNVESVSEDK